MSHLTTKMEEQPLSNSFERKKNDQQETITQLSNTVASRGFGYIYKKYMTHNYHFIKYDILKNSNECKKIAIIFSKYPDIFSGKKRTEIQIDDASVTLSTNDWIKCESLPMCQLDFYVEYYIATIKNLPVTIFFRINKSITDYEDKLNNYLDYLIGKLSITGAEGFSNQQVLIEIKPNRLTNSQMQIQVYSNSNRELAKEYIVSNRKKIAVFVLLNFGLIVNLCWKYQSNTYR